MKLVKLFWERIKIPKIKMRPISDKSRTYYRSDSQRSRMFKLMKKYNSSQNTRQKLCKRENKESKIKSSYLKRNKKLSKLLLNWYLKKRKNRMLNLMLNMLINSQLKSNKRPNKIEHSKQILKEKTIWHSKLLKNSLILTMKWLTICFKARLGIIKSSKMILSLKCKLKDKENKIREARFSRSCRPVQTFMISMK